MVAELVLVYSLICFFAGRIFHDVFTLDEIIIGLILHIAYIDSKESLKCNNMSRNSYL